MYINTFSSESVVASTALLEAGAPASLPSWKGSLSSVDWDRCLGEETRIPVYSLPITDVNDQRGLVSVVRA